MNIMMVMKLIIAMMMVNMIMIMTMMMIKMTSSDTDADLFPSVTESELCSRRSSSGSQPNLAK